MARAMNMRSTIKKAYNKALETYDVLIMPTIPFVATRLPDLDLSIGGKTLVYYTEDPMYILLIRAVQIYANF